MHTPGPWKAVRSIEGDFLGIYPETERMEFPVAKMPDYVKAEVNETNARLIAAAPTLLAELQHVRKGLEQLRRMPGLRTSSEELIKRVDAVIAQAIGDAAAL